LRERFGPAISFLERHLLKRKHQPLSSPPGLTRGAIVGERGKDVDGRVKPGHDDIKVITFKPITLELVSPTMLHAGVECAKL
jgi:hypothetical protein